MLEVRSLTQEDFNFVKANPFEEAIKNYPTFTAPDDNCYTIVFDGEVVAVGGVVILWEGVGEFWLMLTKDSRKHGVYGLLAYMAIREKVEELIETNKLWRAQATVRVELSQAIKMVEALGFEREGLLKQYCPDKGNVYIYARII